MTNPSSPFEPADADPPPPPQHKGHFLNQRALFILLAAALFLFILLSKSRLYELLVPFKGYEEVQQLQQLTRSDQKVFKYHLTNGLPVYYVFDQSLKKSSAAFAVEVGTWDDPEEHHGIAHFGEHMLILGSKHYPVEGDFSNYLIRFDGTANGYTLPDRTVFYMDCSNEGFKQGLDRFCDQIAAPIFFNEAAARERRAIEDELRIKKAKDLFTTYLILGQMSSPHHPARKFHAGSLCTLRNAGPRVLDSWWSKHFRAPGIRLVIFSSFAPQSILPIVTSRLKHLNQEQRAAASHHFLQEFWSKDTLQRRARFASTSSDQLLLIAWPLPPLSDRYYGNNKTALTEVFNHESPTSFVSYLRQQGLCEQVKSRIDLSGNQGLFVVTFTLTQLGSEKKERIEQLTVAQLERYANTQRVPSFLYSQACNICELYYVRAPKQSPELAAPLSASALINESLATFPDQSILPKETAFDEIPSLCRSMLSYAPVIIESTSPLAYSKTLVGVERCHPQLRDLKYFITKEPRHKISPKVRAEAEKIHLFPPHNPYVPTSKQPFVRQEPLVFKKEATKIIETKGLRLHYLKEEAFEGGQSHFHFQITTPFTDSHNIKEFTLQELWHYWITKNQETLVRQAEKAGYKIIMASRPHTLHISITGWSNGIEHVTSDFLKMLQSNYESPPDLKQLKEGYIAKKKYLLANDPFYEAKQTLLSSVFSDRSSVNERIEALKEITEEDLRRFTIDFFSSTHIDILAISPHSQEYISKLAMEWRNLFLPHVHQRSLVHTHLLRKGLDQLVIRKKSQGEGHFVLLYLDHGRANDVEVMAAISIADHEIYAAYFEEIRSKTQMSYLANASVGRQISTQNVSLFFSHSFHAPPSQLLDATKDFIHHYIGQLDQNIPESKFEFIKQLKLQKLSAQPQDISEWSQEARNRIYQEEEQRVTKQQLIEAIENLTYDKFLQNTQRAFESPKEVVVQTTLEENPLLV